MKLVLPVLSVATVALVAQQKVIAHLRNRLSAVTYVVDEFYALRAAVRKLNAEFTDEHLANCLDFDSFTIDASFSDRRQLRQKELRRHRILTGLWKSVRQINESAS